MIFNYTASSTVNTTAEPQVFYINVAIQRTENYNLHQWKLLRYFKAYLRSLGNYCRTELR